MQLLSLREPWKGLPNAELLAEIAVFLGTLSTKLKTIADQLEKALAEADGAVAGAEARWEEKRKTVEKTYEKLLRELQKSEDRRRRVHPPKEAD